MNQKTVHIVMGAIDKNGFEKAVGYPYAVFEKREDALEFVEAQNQKTSPYFYGFWLESNKAVTPPSLSQALNRVPRRKLFTM